MWVDAFWFWKPRDLQYSEKLKYYVWKCGNCEENTIVADSVIWMALCLECYHDLPMV